MSIRRELPEGGETVIRSVIAWLIWFFAVAALVFFLSSAHKAKNQGDLPSPGRMAPGYRLYMD